MNKKIPPRSARIFWFMISFFPLLLLVIQIRSFMIHWSIGLFSLYVLPPLLSNLVCRLSKVRSGRFSTKSREFVGWYISSQIQTLYMRIPVIEEALRFIPRLYSFWLRMWGSSIGKAVTWAPGIVIVDRGLIKVGDYAILGMSSRVGSHHLNALPNGEFELLIGIPTIGKRAVLGGESGVGPGAVVEDFEMLPATMSLAPNYKWQNGRRHSLNPRSNEESAHESHC